VSQEPSRLAAWFTRRPFVLFLALYAGIAALAALGHLLLPEPLHEAIAALTGGAGLQGTDAALFRRGDVAPLPPAAAIWAVAFLAMLSAALLALPLAWLYTITRQKRGYRQSVVHSLILLPVIVAGVVVLVKFSVALAFSLAGIVAAVRFRNTLEDSKDAVYIFAATGIGLAAGVDLPVAATLSFVYNLTTLLLFGADFGRTPARLEGAMAEERMRRALDTANRTGEFVARIDGEILKSMAPEQLEALADRAWQRRKEAAPALKEEEGPRFDAMLSVRTDGSIGARSAVEGVLVRLTKRWQFQHAETTEGGGQLLGYAVRLKKNIQPTWFLDALQEEASAGIGDVELK
jgi:hypothetical protein